MAQAERTKRFRIRARQTGGCIYCTKPAEPGRTRCLSCKLKAHENKRQSMYKLAPGEYQRRLEDQAGVCACCKQEENRIDKRTGEPRRLAVDHDHATLKVRALLCTRCNTLGDDVKVLRLKVEYLEKFGETNE